jgi:DNA-binding XRE family transcriptional regulator
MRLGKVLQDYRYANRMGVRELAKDIGLSPATLSRIENHKPCDGATILKLMGYLFTDGTITIRTKPK